MTASDRVVAGRNAGQAPACTARRAGRGRGPARLPGGASRATGRSTPAGSTVATVPLDLPAGAPGGVRTGGGMETEAALLRGARRGCRWPRSWSPTAIRRRGAGRRARPPWMVMRRIEGETVPRAHLPRRRVRRRPGRRCVAQCGAALAAIHRIPAARCPASRPPTGSSSTAQLLDQLGEPHPAFELGLRWLAAQPAAGDRRADAWCTATSAPATSSSAPTGCRAVLDWELAHLGDPLEDLGWFCVRAWRFGSPRPPAASAPRASWSTRYEAAGGRPVDPEALRWWEVLGTFTWGVICVMQAAHPSHGGCPGRSSWPPSAGGSARTSTTCWCAPRP